MPETDRRDEATPAPLAILLDNHRAFLTFLERRVGDRALAEDILQDAFIRVMDRPDQAPVDEGVVPWFYRTLRNAAIDRFRRRATASRAMEAFAREVGAAAPDGVRVFRAREALKKRVTESCGTCAEHGCRDCSCQSP